YFYEKIKDLNVISQRNLIEIFDSTIGQNTVLQPLGGKKQVNPSQAMVARIPVLDGTSKTASIMTYGFDPFISEKSQYLGGYYAVIESIAKLVSVGSDLEKIRLSFQEFYEKMDNSKAWSKPLKSLLGAFEVTNFFKIPPIGGKDSMSGNFENLKVPPTLISFATTTEDIENIKSNDLKGKGKIGLVRAKYKDDFTLDLDHYKNLLEKLIKAMREGKIITSIALDNKGILANIYEQALGNSNFTLDFDNLYNPLFGSFVVEYVEDLDFVEKIGEFSDDLIVNGEKLDTDKLEKSYLNELDQIFTPKEEISYEKIDQNDMESSLKSKKPVDKVKVSILA
ncbi:MAG: phosphoribosylformylglycinamidine synthase, partial [Anaerococcus hydrogenalis]|nr:phosphoribosylformylglycinamidine synthase [Anaerococcus hydrogenalis]